MIFILYATCLRAKTATCIIEIKCNVNTTLSVKYEHLVLTYIYGDTVVLTDIESTCLYKVSNIPDKSCRRKTILYHFVYTLCLKNTRSFIFVTSINLEKYKKKPCLQGVKHSPHPKFSRLLPFLAQHILKISWKSVYAFYRNIAYR